MTFGSIEPDFTITPRPPSKPGVYLLLDGSRRVMYVGLARDLQGVLYRYQHLEGRQEMRDRIAGGEASWVSWTECAHPASPPSLEVLAIRRYRPPWNKQHNPTPLSESDAVVFAADEQRWLSDARRELDEALHRVTSVVVPDESPIDVVNEHGGRTARADDGGDREPLHRGADTCRDAVLLAMLTLERRTQRTDFQLQEIVREVQSHTKRYPETTIRTHVTSVMCADAPMHHQNHTDDLERVERGKYRRRETPARSRSASDAVAVSREERIVEARRRASATHHERAAAAAVKQVELTEHIRDLTPLDASSQAATINLDTSIPSLGPESTPVEWDAAVEAARSVVIGAARRGEKITYGELRVAAYEATGMKVGHSMFGRLCMETNRASDQCLLSSIIVKTDTGEPGRGFVPYARSQGFDAPVETLQRMTFEHFAKPRPSLGANPPGDA